ncbi:hypothetical protein ACHAXS_013145 [Conticribra weissflogii]
MKMFVLSTLSTALLSTWTISAFHPPSYSFGRVKQNHSAGMSSTAIDATRREVIRQSSVAFGIASAASILSPTVNAAPALQDSLPIEEFLRTGVDPSGPMGISAQAGKTRPQTGVVFRDGTEVLQGRDGNISAELLVGTKANPTAVLVSFKSPYKLETGPVFDVECRDGKTGDGAFVAVTESTKGKSLAELPSEFFLDRLFNPTVKKSTINGDQRIMEVSFSNLTQSTNAEIPRKAIIAATIPKGADNAVMLVASANANRWKKGSEVTARGIIDSFRAVPAPKTELKMRAKDRSGGSAIDF